MNLEDVDVDCHIDGVFFLLFTVCRRHYFNLPFYYACAFLIINNQIYNYDNRNSIDLYTVFIITVTCSANEIIGVKQSPCGIPYCLHCSRYSYL
jgi:hypothetical protein